MLQRFSTRLISGGGFLYKIWQVFFCTMPGWPWLRVLAPRLGRTSCGDWNWTIFACLLFHSHFYGEGQATPLSLIGCWCSNRNSQSVLGVKNVSQWDHSLSFRPIWSILNWYAGGTWLSWEPQTMSFFGLGSWNKYLGHSSEKRKLSHSSAVSFLYCIANCSRAARCLAVSRGFFCLLSGLQRSLFINLQMLFFPPTVAFAC